MERERARKEGSQEKAEENKNSTILKSASISFFRYALPPENSGVFNYINLPAETSLCHWISNVTVVRAPPENHRYNFISFTKTDPWLFSKDFLRGTEKAASKKAPRRRTAGRFY